MALARWLRLCAICLAVVAASGLPVRSLAASASLAKAAAQAKPSGQARTEAPAGKAEAAQAGGKAASKPAERGKQAVRLGKVVIDPGHGGTDTGAAAGGLLEKDLALRFARHLGAELKTRGFDVGLTRTRDQDLPLADRIAQANAARAGLFISVHAGFHPDPKVSGFEVFSLNLACSEDSVRAAARENATDHKPISDLPSILARFARTPGKQESRLLAEQVQSRLEALFHSGRGVREAPFCVLMDASMPAVLVSLGYLSNPAEASRLKSDTYLKALARGTAEGLEAYRQTMLAAKAPAQPPAKASPQTAAKAPAQPPAKAPPQTAAKAPAPAKTPAAPPSPAAPLKPAKDAKTPPQ